MNDLYRTRGPISPPSAPTQWSFSSLQEWRRCPRRWWLLRAGYPGIQGRYPQPVHAATIAGRLVHDALESFANHVATELAGGTTFDVARCSFPVRAFMKRRLRELVAEEIKPNPRADSANILAKLSLDECVNDFRSAVRGIMTPSAPRHSIRPERGLVNVTAGESSLGGAEISLSIEDPPLTGRLDWTRSGVVCDFKTGEPDPAHAEQLRMYALLIWAALGVLPEGLEIYYIRSGERVPVPVPSEVELNEFRDALRHEVIEASNAIRSGAVAANPNVDGCRWCPVRQHCDAFWHSPLTNDMRWPTCANKVDDAIEPVLFADVELKEFVSDTNVHGYHGIARTVVGIPVIVSLPADWIPGPGIRPERLRLLGARIEVLADRNVVSVSKGTEVFWLEWDVQT